MVQPNLRSQTTLKDIATNTGDLPAFPAAALQIMRESESPTCTAARIAELINHDPALCARVLRLANSPYYGLARQIADVQDAVVLLGLRSVRNLAMVAATYAWMQQPIRAYDLQPKQMWLNAFGTAYVSQEVARLVRVPDTDQVFTAGLLHDLGKIAIGLWLETRAHGTVRVLVRQLLRKNATFDSVEKQVLGFTHADMGSHLAEMWNLPRSIGDAIKYHHDPDACEPASKIVDCVHVGMVLSETMAHDAIESPEGADAAAATAPPEAGVVSDEAATALPPVAMPGPMLRLRLKEQDLVDLRARSQTAFAGYARMFDDPHVK